MKTIFFIVIIALILFIYARTIYIIYHMGRRVSTLELFIIAFFPIIGPLFWFLYYKERNHRI